MKPNYFCQMFKNSVIKAAKFMHLL